MAAALVTCSVRRLNSEHEEGRYILATHNEGVFCALATGHDNFSLVTPVFAAIAGHRHRGNAPSPLHDRCLLCAGSCLR